MNPSEWKILVSLIVAGIFLLYLLKAKPRKENTTQSKPKQSLNKLWDSVRSLSPLFKAFEKKKPPQVHTIEIFDYDGTKITHENGLWTVNEKGMIRSYKDWENLPPRYQKMVKELDNRSLQDKGSGAYFLEMLNGYYYVTLPGGKKRKYKSFSEIPPEIQKWLKK